MACLWWCKPTKQIYLIDMCVWTVECLTKQENCFYFNIGLYGVTLIVSFFVCFFHFLVEQEIEFSTLFQSQSAAGKKFLVLSKNKCSGQQNFFVVALLKAES
jgi:hypothetical protein